MAFAGLAFGIMGLFTYKPSVVAFATKEGKLDELLKEREASLKTAATAIGIGTIVIFSAIKLMKD